MTMKKFETAAVNIEEVEFDHDLHIFKVTNKDGEMLGTIVPPDVEDMNLIIRELANGGCPVADKWEDGMGNSCTMNGWGEYEKKI